MTTDETMNLMRECIPIFSVLADENRHQILRLLLEQGKMNVNAITEKLHLSRPAVSHHLKLMLAAGAVSVEQVGKERFYAIAMAEATQKLQQLSAAFALYCPSQQR
ncbi:metalloregulator ArsR/SmtB family transcription factor [Actinobacillus suis]|nr:metalloregulator ArsR/SmtB family transcription factor [Actinobacillus suis]MCO4166230.1 metalloregulator ArsR/SmtB family transcription factor [Actinobacillus suis]MCO4169535.1 metalloregulator ArsR/SmtB family transcription factor [Actinobacillus suis]MCQ9629300.1 metalloregulator ArsR/SmtB family transcription factor [Actinobacillus suis]MCQ9632350.1 metalloregulator ArsR/SmtB family transcription factor [Actinobacillus suis]MCQ9711100.1 metalloregulator ArsR/SmtB family transcription fa